MSFIWEKSSTWRWIVASGRSSKGFMVAFTGACFLVPYVVGQGVMNATNYNNERLQNELLKQGRGRDSLLVGRVNKERLQQFLDEIQRKEDTEDRYKAALRGETLTGTPGARIRGGGGSSVKPQVLSESTKILETTALPERATPPIPATPSVPAPKQAASTSASP